MFANVKVLVLWSKLYGYVMFYNGSKWVFGTTPQVCVHESFRPQMIMEMMNYVMSKISSKFR